MATTTRPTSSHYPTLVEETKKINRADSAMSGAATPSTVGDLTPGLRARLDSNDPFWGLDFTQEMATKALNEEIEGRAHREDFKDTHTTWRLHPDDVDLVCILPEGVEDSDGYVMKFADFDLSVLFDDHTLEVFEVERNLWEIEMFGPISLKSKGLFMPEPIQEERFVTHGHDYDNIDESELCDFWQCWTLNPIKAVDVVNAVKELLEDPVYVLAIDSSIIRGAHWLSLIRPKVLVRLPLVLSSSQSIDITQPEVATSSMVSVLVGGAKLAHLNALLVRLKHHELVEADPRVAEKYRWCGMNQRVLDRFPADAWPTCRWIGPVERLYVVAQVVFVRDRSAIKDIVKDAHISWRAVSDVGQCPGLAVARGATAARVLLFEDSKVLEMAWYELSALAQEVATMVVSSALDSPWPCQKPPPAPQTETTFSHRFEREPWVPLSRLSSVYAGSTMGPLMVEHWKDKEPSKYTVLVERLHAGVEGGRIYTGPRYLPPSCALSERVKCCLDFLSWTLLYHPERCRSMPLREALRPLTHYSDYVAVRVYDMLTGIGALMGLVKPGLWVDAYWLQWWSPRTSSKLSSYGSDRFAWKQPGVAACETMCVRVPQVPCKRVIDAIGSAGAIPVDHLASYIEMKTIERSSWSYMALDKLAHRVVLVMKCLGVLVMMYATVPTQEGHLPCIGPVSVYTCGIVSMAWASGRGGVWLGVLGTWFKVPTSLTGEWPVDDYVLVLAITTLLSPSGLPAALTFPTTPEWVVSSLALPSLFPEVGIQALWLYLLGSILGNLLLCREMQGQAGVAAVLGYMLGNKLMNVGQVGELSLVGFHHLGPLMFTLIYGLVVWAVHEVFTPRAKKAILGGGIWLKSCALVVLAGIVCSAVVVPIINDFIFS